MSSAICAWSKAPPRQPSPLRERITLVRGRGLALRVGNHFEKSHNEENHASEAGERQQERVREQAMQSLVSVLL